MGPNFIAKVLPEDKMPPEAMGYEKCEVCTAKT